MPPLAPGHEAAAELGDDVSSTPHGSPPFGRPETIELQFCDDVLIRGISIRNSPFWTIRPFACRNVTVERVQIRNACDGAEVAVIHRLHVDLAFSCGVQ